MLRTKEVLKELSQKPQVFKVVSVQNNLSEGSLARVRDKNDV